MSKIKKLIKLAERATPGEWSDSEQVISGNDGKYILAACPANLLPILRAAEKMAEVLRLHVEKTQTGVVRSFDAVKGVVNFTMGPVEVWSPATEALAEWKKVNE